MKVTYRYTYLAQKCENIQYYRLDGAAFLTATVLGVLEALWNDQKTALRSMMGNLLADASWDSLLGNEIGGGLGYAEFPVPTAERVGLRAVGSLGDPVSSFTAGGFRQTVGTRVTRPGQKRFPFIYETDIDRNTLGVGYLSGLDAVAIKFSAAVTLGAPVATGLMHPEIAHLTGAPPVPTTYQDVTGYVKNSNVTSQVSRKLGRGI